MFVRQDSAQQVNVRLVQMMGVGNRAPEATTPVAVTLAVRRDGPDDKCHAEQSTIGEYPLDEYLEVLARIRKANQQTLHDMGELMQSLKGLHEEALHVRPTTEDGEARKQPEEDMDSVTEEDDTETSEGEDSMCTFFSGYL